MFSLSKSETMDCKSRFLCRSLETSIRMRKSEPPEILYCAYRGKWIIIVFKPVPQFYPTLRLGSVLDGSVVTDEDTAKSYFGEFARESLEPGFGLTSEAERVAHEWCSRSSDNVFMFDYGNELSDFSQYPRSVSGLRGLKGYIAVVDRAS